MSAGVRSDDPEFYDFKYFDESRGLFVYVNDGEVVREREPPKDVALDVDAVQASDRCETCTALVACQRCIDVREDVRDERGGEA